MPAKRSKPGFYAVRIGRKPGVYTTWDACKEQVLGFSNARFKKFSLSEDAWAFSNQSPPLELQPRDGVELVDVDQTVELLQSSRFPSTSLSNQNYSGSGRAQTESTGSEVEEVATLSTDPLAAFFAQYKNFEYEQARSATDEFYRLCNLYGWGKPEVDQRMQDAKQGFQDALTLQFNQSYGTDIDDLTKWQALCAKLGMDPVPENLKTCREAVRSTHVNLVDLVDIFGTQEKAHTFPTEVALSEYTKKHGKFFPRDNIHAGDLLKFLLRQIIRPRTRAEGRRGRIHRKEQKQRDTWLFDHLF